MNTIYYNTRDPAGYSSVSKLQKASNVKRKVVEEWLTGQDTYTLHKPVRKRFPRNPYTVTNIDDVWEMDLADMSNLAKHNGGYKYLLNVIDIFSRFAWSMPLKSKTGTAVAQALEKLFKVRKPISIQTDKGAEFLNSTVQKCLKKQGISFHTTHNPDIKGAIIERFNRTLKTRMYKYFTRHNTYRYVNVLGKLIAAYNNSVHSTLNIQPAAVNASNVYDVWRRLHSVHAKIPQGRVKYVSGDLVRITREKLKFDKGYEQTYSTEIFRVVKVIDRKPQPVYELTDLRDRPIEGQFYNYELVKVSVTPQTEFKIDKIMRSRKRDGIIEKLVRWKGYDSSFDSWVKASEIKNL